MIPALSNPKTNWIIPPKTTAKRKFSKPPKVPIAVKTMAANPAAGPLTPMADPLKDPTTIPPIIPAIKPEKSGAPLAKAIPKQSGKATKNTTTLDGKSFFILPKKVVELLFECIMFFFYNKHRIDSIPLILEDGKSPIRFRYTNLVS